MGFWNLDTRASDIKEMAEMAGGLGFSGIGAISAKGLVEKQEAGIDISPGILLSGTAGVIRKNARAMRRKVELIVVKGGEESLNRAIVESPEIDILSEHLIGGRCGINHVLARLASDNNVAIEFDFSLLLDSYKRHRTRVVSGLLETARYVRKYGSPFVLVSTASGPWELRSPSELAAFGRFLGFPDPQIKKALSGGMVEENRKRLSGKWIMPGVEKQ
jgi:ribonuclease P/MRP protein subunit RPP1